MAAEPKDLSRSSQIHRVIGSDTLLKHSGYWVYIMANTNGRAATLYVGMTSNLERRLRSTSTQRPIQSTKASLNVTALHGSCTAKSSRMFAASLVKATQGLAT